jgi:hypothetical protein
MPPRSLMRSFLLLWMVTGVVLFVASVRTVAEAAGPHANPHLVLLGGVEALSALLFLMPWTLRLGAVGLLTTIGIAFLVHTLMGQFRGDLLLYAAAVVFVSVHGSLTRPQWRALV